MNISPSSIPAVTFKRFSSLSKDLKLFIVQMMCPANYMLFKLVSKDCNAVVSDKTFDFRVDFRLKYLCQDRIPFIVGRMKRLGNVRTLNFSSNSLGTLDALWVSQLPTLRTLDMSDNYLGWQGARNLSGTAAEIHTLYIGDNGIGDEGIYFIANKMRHLKFLDISKSLISAKGVKWLMKLEKLEVLIAPENQILDLGASYIGQMNSLRYVDLRRNGITLTGMQYLKPLHDSGTAILLK
jgi:Leucine-rich repeat (LRR) protein